MTKVLQVFGALVLGGAESRVMDIYRQMNPEICTFDFVSMKQEKQYYEEEIQNLGGKIYKIGFPREVGTLRNLKELRQCMRKDKYDAVHAHTSYHCGIVMLAAWLEHIPVRISHARTNGSRQKNIVNLIPLIFGKILINIFSTRKIAISKEAGKFLFGNSKFDVIPNAIDTKKYQSPNLQQLEKYKDEFEIPKGATVIGHIGRFDAMKNHQFVLDRFADFIKVKTNAILLLVGNGELFNSMKDYASNLGISDYVRFLGERSDVPQLIHLFDAMLFPSVFEGLGGVVIEAQAAGVPTIESDSVPVETDLELGLVERLSLTESSDEWTQHLSNALEKKRNDFDDIKNTFVIKGYDINSITEKYINFYRGNI